MSEPFSELAEALAPDGIRCTFMRPGQLAVSNQDGNVWPDRGNSFWLTRAGGRWYLFTWAPRGYHIPDSADVAALCRTCMAFGTSTMGSVPPDISQRFSLVELSEAEAEAVIDEGVRNE